MPLAAPRLPMPIQVLQDRAEDLFRRLWVTNSHLEAAKRRAFTSALPNGFKDECTKALSALRGPCNFDRKTHALLLSATGVHLTPLLRNNELVANFIYDEHVRAPWNRPLAAISASLRDMVSGDVEPKATRQTLVHSMSLIPTPAFLSGMPSRAFRDQWDGVSDPKERYTEQTEWFSLTHGMRDIQRCLQRSFVSAIGSQLTDAEIEAVSQRYTNYNRAMVRDALYALRLKRKSTGASPGSGRAAKAGGDAMADDAPEPLASVEVPEVWPWARAPIKTIGVAQPLGPSAVHTPHGPVYTQHDTVFVHMGFNEDAAGGGGGVEIPDLDGPARHVQITIDITTRRLVPERIHGPKTCFGLFSNLERLDRRYILLSQHVSVRVAYSTSYVAPSPDEMKVLPVTFKIATANMGFTQDDGEAQTDGTPPVSQTGLVMHVLGRGAPLSIYLEQPPRSECVNPFFTHGDGRPFPTELLSYGLMLRTMRLFEELQHNPVFFRLALSGWMSLMHHNDQSMRNALAASASGNDASLFQQFQSAQSEKEALRIAGAADFSDDMFPAAFRDAFNLKGTEPAVQRFRESTGLLLGYILRNGLAPYQTEAGNVSNYTQSNTDGGVHCMGFNSQGRDLNRASLHITFTPVARPYNAQEGSYWDPPYQRLFYRKWEPNPGAPEFQPVGENANRMALNAACTTSGIWGPPVDAGGHWSLGMEEGGMASHHHGMGQDAGSPPGSPDTAFSGGFQALDLHAVTRLAQTRSAFDRPLYINQ